MAEFQHNPELAPVQDVLLHRPPSLYLDGVTSIEGPVISGFWTPSKEDYAGHFPDMPVLMGFRAAESLAQLGAYRAQLESKGKTSVLLTGADEFTFIKPILPGSTLGLSVEALPTSGKREFAGRGTVVVEEEICVQGIIRGLVVPMRAAEALLKPRG